MAFPRTLSLVLAGALAVLGAEGLSGTEPTQDRTAPDTLRVLAYNIHHGEGMDEALDLERIAALIREVDPDLVTLQEVDSVTSRTNAIDQAAELGRLTGLKPVFGRFMSYQGGAYGMALLSRWEISESANYRLPDGAEPRTALSAVVTSPKTGRRLRFVGIHFYRTAEERLAQAVTLERLLSESAIPTILAGDFNSTPDSEVIIHLANSWAVGACLDATRIERVGRPEDWLRTLTHRVHAVRATLAPDREAELTSIAAALDEIGYDRPVIVTGPGDPSRMRAAAARLRSVSG